jgi:hypothetical protein
MRYILLLPLLLMAAACTDQVTQTGQTPGNDSTPPAPVPLGMYQITLTGMGGADMRASVAPVPSGIDASMSAVNTGLAFEFLSSSTVIEGARGQGGQRYVSYTYRVRNTTGGPLSNVTVIPTSGPGTIAGTPFSSVLLFNGAAASPAVAASIVPTGAVFMGEDGELRSQYSDVLQVFQESEVAAITLPAGTTNIFPYGFVVRNPSTPNSRTLPNAADGNDYAGRVTFGFRYPLQPGGANSDPFTITFYVLAVQDTETRVTESIEESQDTAAVRRIRARAAELSATTVTVLNGSTVASSEVADYPGQRQICSVRTAGPAGTPTTRMTAPAAYTRLLLLRPGESLDGCSAGFRAGAPARPAINVPFTVTVTAIDRYGNLKTAVVDTVRLVQESGPPATLGGPAALVSGQRALTVTYGDYGTSQLGAAGRRLVGEQPILVAGVVRTWTAGAGTTDWHTGANWSPAAVPMSLDSVLVPVAAPLDPVLAANVSVAGVTVEDAATLGLGAFDLTATGDVFAGLNGGITNTTGRLNLAGTGRTVQGRLPRLRVMGTYTLSGTTNTRAPLMVEAGRITPATFRLQVDAN